MEQARPLSFLPCLRRKTRSARRKETRRFSREELRISKTSSQAFVRRFPCAKALPTNAPSKISPCLRASVFGAAGPSLKGQSLSDQHSGPPPFPRDILPLQALCASASPREVFPPALLALPWRTWRTLRETFFCSPGAKARQDAAPPEVARSLLNTHRKFRGQAPWPPEKSSEGVFGAWTALRQTPPPKTSVPPSSVPSVFRAAGPFAKGKSLSDRHSGPPRPAPRRVSFPRPRATGT